MLLQRCIRQSPFLTIPYCIIARKASSGRGRHWIGWDKSQKKDISLISDDGNWGSIKPTHPFIVINKPMGMAMRDKQDIETVEQVILKKLRSLNDEVFFSQFLYKL